tara:strand:- start:1500 stop:1730 length:231 start_codon:yes stop_codon:yes gene_type:complete
MENFDQQMSKVREDLAEVKTDVKHVLLHLERQNGRIGRLEEDVDGNKNDIIKAKTMASVLSGTVSLIVSLFISNRP